MSFDANRVDVRQRPFVYFYCPVFLLYELSSPFLNIHWFCDKLELTGSIYQAINGALLTSTFFCCRIVWGQYSSYRTFSDMYTAVSTGHSLRPAGILGEEVEMLGGKWMSGDFGLYLKDDGQKTVLVGQEYLPLWLAGAYFVSNLVLNILNIYWFSKMVETIRKRFNPPIGTKGVGNESVRWEPQEKLRTEEKQRIDELHKAGMGSVTAGRQKAEQAMNGAVSMDGAAEVQRGVYADGHKSIEVTGTTRRSAKSRRKA